MYKRMSMLILSIAILASSTIVGGNLTVHATTNQDVITTFGGAEAAVYGVPASFQTRYNAIALKVRGPFAYMGLSLNFTMPTSNFIVNASVDTCAMDRDALTLCPHGSASTCDNEGPYHCSNAVFISDTLFPGHTAGEDITVFMTAAQLCWKNGDNEHRVVYGLAGDGVAVIQDSDADKGEAGLGDSKNIYWVSKTMAHEIGHFWGAEDHYEVEFGDRRDNCIWGYNKDLPSVFQNLAYCAECHDTMYININNIEF